MLYKQRASHDALKATTIVVYSKVLLKIPGVDILKFAKAVKLSS